MENNLIIVILIILAMLAWSYLYETSNNFNIISLFLISYVLFYDLHAISDILGNHVIGDNFLSIFTLLILWGGAGLFILSSRVLIKKKYMIMISYSKIIQHSRKISIKMIYFIILIPLMIIIYYFINYNFIFRVPDIYYSEHLNAYRMIIEGIVKPILYILLIILTSRLFYTKNKIRKYIFVLIIILILIYLLLYSRRSFVLGLILWGTFYGYIKYKNMFSIKRFPLLFVLGLLVFMGSNLYQNLRYPLMEYSVTNKISLDKSLLEMIFDYKSTEDNLEDRTSLFTANTRIMNEIIYNNQSPLGGEITIQSFINIIPKIIYPEKKVVNDDLIIAQGFGFFATDLGTSMQSALIADYGIYSVIIFPIIMYLYLVIVLFLLNKYKNNSIVYLFIIALVVKNIFNLESTLGSLLFSLKDILLIIIFLSFLNFILKINGRHQ